MESRASVIIQRPIAEVFRFTTENVADWSKVVEEDEVVEDKGGVGTTFRTVTSNRGQHLTFRGIITEHEPPHKISIHMVSDQIDIAVKYKFSDLGAEGTKVLQGSQVTFRGLIGVIFKLFGFLLRSSSCRAAQEEMENLKRYCERQPASTVDDHGL